MNKQSIISAIAEAALCGLLALQGAMAEPPSSGNARCIQDILTEELDKGLQQYHAKGGCMIAVNPKTGELLGLAGDFDFACRKLYEPGSTFKVVAATAALDTGKMKIDTRVDCHPFAVDNAGGINDGLFNYSSLPLWGILAKSSNPGIARVALACGWDNYREYLHRYGLDMPVRDGVSGVIPDGSNAVNLIHMAHGRAVSVTPLHMAMVYAAIANNGVRVKPLYNTRASNDPQAGEGETRVMSEKTAADLRLALETVTKADNPDGIGKGTATAASIPGFRIGGKTGTAKKKGEDGKYIEGAYIVSFAGILPIDNPRLVIMTVIDEPHPTDCNPGGGAVAAPVFHAAAERIIDLLHLTPSDPAAYERHRNSQDPTVSTTQQ